MYSGRTKVAAAACAVLLATVSTGAIAQPQTTFIFNQPAESLSQALRDVAARTGRNVIAPDGFIGSRQAPALSGSFTAEGAVTRLLRGSGLQLTFSGNDLIVATAPSKTAKALNSAENQTTITITGTHIRGVGSVSPVGVTTRDQLYHAGTYDLAGFAQILPQNYTGGQNRGIAGGGEQGGQENTNDSTALNLRGLGPDATLTLLNGHRLPYDAVYQGVDVSAIPLGAVERIEVVADGASALYGSDAVAGVANIILRQDYEGLEATARIGGATDGGDFQQQYSLVAGHRWKHGGFMAAFDQSTQTPITAGQRDYTRLNDPSFFLINRIRQSSGVLNAHQQITSGLEFDVDGYEMSRVSFNQDPFLSDADVHVAGIVSEARIRSWAVTPTLRAELGTWQASLSSTVGRSLTTIGASNYWSGVARVGNNIFGDKLSALEAAAEGPVLMLPGGPARLAFGFGLRHISLHVDERIDSATIADSTLSRNVQFAYGELSMPLVKNLTLSGALRYEHWNHIAAETTPKVGLIFRPTSSVTLRATWGKSFKIPTLYQASTPQDGALIPGLYFDPPPQPAGAAVLFIGGSAPSLKPERSTNWSGTFEWKPQIIPGLDLQATYFHVNYRNRIAAPIEGSLNALYNPVYASLITYNPSPAEVNAIIGNLPGGFFNETGAPLDPTNVAAIMDDSSRNTARQTIRGLDFNADYLTDVGGGARLRLSGAASYLLSNQQLSPGQPLVQLAGTIFNPPHWRGRGGAVIDGKQASFSAFVNVVGSTSDNRFKPATTIGSFVSFDLSAAYRTAAKAGPLSKVEFRLSALNILNQAPRLIRLGSLGGAPYDSTNQSPVGRFVAASIRKVW